MYGWRARIGQIVPSLNTCIEPEFNRIAPKDVCFYTTRLRLVGGGTKEELMAMANGVEDAAALLADAKVDLIIFNCTGSSMAGGPGYDQEIIRRIEGATGVPATTTITGVVAALKRLAVRKFVLVSPYTDLVNGLEEEYFAGTGFQVLKSKGLGLTDGMAFMAVNPGDWYRLVKENQMPEADGYFISCVNVRSSDAIEDLERDLKKPVITSIQAALWHCLDKVGVRVSVPGFGTLLRDCLG